MLEKKIKREANLRVEKSLYPEGENTHILVLESSTEHGWNFEGIFKGTRKECIEKKKELEENNEPKKRILEYLEKNQTITTLESVMQLGITDPQHYIMELRNEGYNITDQWINGTNRVGRKIKYKRYRLEKENGR